jgi:predicted dehydrogenase
MKTERKLRAGIVGLGIGKHHLEGYREHPGVEVVAIADTDPARLAGVGDAFGVQGRYPTVEAMLGKERLDILSVCTPNKFHRDIAIRGFEAGCHVLCEKPMAMNAAEGEEMVAAAKKAGKRLMIDFSYRFSEESRALKAQVDSGILGDIYFARTVWHRRRGLPGFGGWFGIKELSGGGPLIDLGVHRLDLALWLMGYPDPVWVMGSTGDSIARPMAERSGKKFTVEDFAAGFVKFRNGATLEIEASWAANIRENELMETRLLGTRAGLLQRNVNEEYKFEAEIFLEREGCQFDMKLHPPLPSSHGAMYSFVEAILTDAPHPAPGEEGLVVMRILDAIYASASRGEPVRLG